MTTLYKKDNKGNTRVWSIRVEEPSHLSYNYLLQVESSLLGGKVIYTTTPITEGLGGKSTLEQAEFDMQSEINKKIKSGYVDSLDKLKDVGHTATVPKPMKAETYHPTGKNKAYTLDRLGIRGKMIYVQPKLDGWRFRIHLFMNPQDGEISVTFYTSSGDVSPSFPHIEESLKSSFDKYVRYDVGFGVPVELMLDGEIYNHELGFQATASACGTTKKITPEKLELRSKMQFHLFDICDTELGYDDRRNVIGFFEDEKTVMHVRSIEIEKANEKEIDEMFEQFLSEGYEGLMIRIPNSKYEYKRSKNLIKYKPRHDEECKIIDFLESIEKNTLGSLLLEMEDGKIFSCNLMGELGTDEFKKHVWDNQEEYRFKLVNVLHYGYMESGLPRQPYARYFRKGIGED